MVEVFHLTKILKGEVDLPASKSISNRLLILQALHPKLKLKNLSEAEDTEMLKNALNSGKGEIYLNHAGSTLRFLTAYYAFNPGAEVLLTGSERLKNRPISTLVDALKNLGAKIEYVEKNGFAPLKIIGVEKPIKNNVSINASISSQFISALMLNAYWFKEGLHIQLKGKLASAPYLRLTQKLMIDVGYKVELNSDNVFCKWQVEKQTQFEVEPDWSGATFFLAMAINAKTADFILKGLSLNSLQGDAAQVEIFKVLGVNCTQEKKDLRITKNGNSPSILEFDLSAMPDVTQGLAVGAALKGIPIKLTGLETLPNKESNRIEDLATELRKLGIEVETSSSTISTLGNPTFLDFTKFSTYHDHRMAMAFAVVALKTKIFIQDEAVVQKSFPSFWVQLNNLGFVTQIT